MKVDLALVGKPMTGDNCQYLVKYHDYGRGAGHYSRSGFPLGEVYDVTWRSLTDTLVFCKGNNLEVVYIQQPSEKED